VTQTCSAECRVVEGGFLAAEGVCVLWMMSVSQGPVSKVIVTPSINHVLMLAPGMESVIIPIVLARVLNPVILQTSIAQPLVYVTRIATEKIAL